MFFCDKDNFGTKQSSSSFSMQYGKLAIYPLRSASLVHQVPHTAGMVI